MPEPKRPFKRARKAFDPTDLKRVCEMHETEFADAYDMTGVGVQQKAPDDFYLFRDNGSPILAVAHLDTVQPHERRTANFLNTAGGPVVYSGALDDRLGAYTILEWLPAMGITYDVLLTVGEECGRSTAAFFESADHHEREYDWIIEFDRGGTDVVMYDYEDDETCYLVEDSGAKVGQGIFTDICYLEHVGVKAFNWGTGYRDYHSPRSHAYLEDTWQMMAHFLDFHETNSGIRLPHAPRDLGWWRDDDPYLDDKDDEVSEHPWFLDTQRVARW